MGAPLLEQASASRRPGGAQRNPVSRLQRRTERCGSGPAPEMAGAGGPMERLRRLWRGRTMTFGVPLLLYLVGGSFGLREFAQIRYDVHKLHGKVDPALKEKLKQNNVTLESEYKKLEKSDLDNWENIRGPQLWEDSRTVQKQRREAARLKTE
ncbi:cytochrome c oxidase assembly protein COX16 homolog, mitochondrial isoform X1 [Numida meleagris]|uniref:cytochrome c oxidase assembly protein COX16 homolog, mitochondrial isoform X1 n=1 Tax=Numida meleagris TaxID=8996 RepID=UPI000B3E1FA2|nr:cytochrome c oxidase assembly protein COX16 homolog, mitochondrial isoform X1 [Numida meleagris]